MEFEASSSRSERTALGIFALIAVASMFWVARSVAVGIFLGTLTAFMFEPMYERLQRRMHSPGVSRAVTLAAATLGICVLLIGTSILLIDRGIVIVQAIVESLQPGGAARATLEDVSARLAPYGVNLTSIVDKVREAAASLASLVASAAAAIAAQTFNVILTVFFMLLTMNFVLAKWATIARRMEAVLPLTPSHTRALVTEFHDVGRLTLLGSVVTGVAQGFLSGLIYWACGISEPAFFGAATAVASLVPGVGTLLVWVPAGLFLVVEVAR